MKEKTVIYEDSLEYNLDKKRKNYFKKNSFKINCIKFIPSLLMCCFGFFGILLAISWLIVSTMFFDHRIISEFSPTIRIWFGVPGSGKTSVAAWLSQYSLAAGYKVLSNVEIKGTYKLEEEDLGKYDMSFGGQGCHVIYDEATVSGLDNRNYSKFANTEKPRYFAIHRHMHNRVDVFSQGYDIDKRVRDRASSNGLFYLKRTGLKGFVMYRAIKKVLFITKEDKQIVDGFSFKGLPRILYTKSIWNSFDTLDDSLCPKEQKNWELWN